MEELDRRLKAAEVQRAETAAGQAGDDRTVRKRIAYGLLVLMLLQLAAADAGSA
jgi:hypothetical protein